MSANDGDEHERINPSGKRYTGYQQQDKKTWLKRPELLKPGSSWRQFLSSFQNYAKLAKIPKEEFIPALISYLAPQLAEKVLALELSQEQLQDPEIALPLLHPIMDGPTSKITNRILLSKLKQTGSVTSFAEEIRIKSLLCKFETSNVRNASCIQAFLVGLKDDSVCEEILKANPPVNTFEQAVEIATQVSLAKEASKSRERESEWYIREHGK